MRDREDTNRRPRPDDVEPNARGLVEPGERLPFRPAPWWTACLHPPSRRWSGGAIEVPVRDPGRPALALGRRLVVEVELGSHADAVRLRGEVVEHFERLRGAALLEPASLEPASSESASPESASILLGLDPGQEARVAYVRDVLHGARDATSRRHRRYATELFLRWDDGVVRHEGRTADLSLGGAAVEAKLAPPAGSAVLLSLRDPSGEALEVASTVAWVREGRPDARFGIRFRPDDEAHAAQVARLIRRHGRQPTPPLRVREPGELHSGPS